MTSYFAYDQGLPCRNPACNSHGRPHPNCRCYSQMAEGGTVENFCSKMLPHEKGCAYYADGGTVETQPPVPQDDPSVTLGHAGIHHGLTGLLKNVGRSKLAEPDKHVALFEEAKNQHEARINSSGEEFKRTRGTRLGHHIADQDHERSAERLHGHPVVGGIGKGDLEPIMKRLGPEMIARESHPEAFRSSVDYLHSAMKGAKQLSEALRETVGEKKSGEMQPDKGSRENLKAFLEESRENPASLLDVGGTLGHYLPDHGAALGALTATATDYLNGLRPQQAQENPLDDPTPIDKMAEAKFNRALDIANHPLLTLQHVKDGTLLPNDINTVKVIYPALYRGMVSQMTERLIKAKADGEEIPYRQKQSMSLFLGQPLDATQTPAAMQAIIASAGMQQAQKQAEKQRHTTDAALKQMNKVDDLYALPTERRQIDKNS